MYKITFFGASPTYCTGYGLLQRNIIQRLLKDNEFKKDFTMNTLGLQTEGHIDQKLGFPITPRNYDIWCADRTLQCMERCDLFVTFCDMWVPQLAYFPEYVKRSGVKYAVHVTVNSEPLSPHIYQKINCAHYLISPSKYVGGVLARSRLNSAYIPHGVDLDIFKPDEEKREYLRKLWGYENKFVILSAMRNNGAQKNFGGLIDGYRIFLDNNPDAKKDSVLHLHCDPIENGAYNLIYLIQMKKLEGNVLFTRIEQDNDFKGIHFTKLNEGVWADANIGINPEMMSYLYNMSDVSGTTSFGESFSLPLLESCACGKPIFAPAHTTSQELIVEPNTGLTCKLPRTCKGRVLSYITPLISDQWLTDVDDVADVIAKLYNSEQLRKTLSTNCLKMAKEYEWDSKIIPRWKEFFYRAREDTFRRVDYKKGEWGI